MAKPCRHDWVLVSRTKIGSRLYLRYECRYCGATRTETEYD